MQMLSSLLSAAPAVPAPAASPAPAGQSAASAPVSGIPDISLSWGSYFEALAVICFVLAVLWAVVWLLKRRSGTGLFASTAPSMRVESRLALGPKKWICIVRCMEKRLVLGVTDKSITLLSETPLSEEELAPAPKKPLFTFAARNKGQTDGAPLPDIMGQTAGSGSGSAFSSFLKRENRQE